MKQIQSLRVVAFLLYGCAVTTFVGCGSDKPTVLAGSSSVHEADDHHHDHLHDHGIPDHKPATFAQAVEQLPRRRRLVMSEFKAGHLDHAREAIQKLQDVIRWLPELAADTDLGKSDWNTIQTVSRQMEDLVKPWKTMQSQPAAQESELLQALTEQLKALTEKSSSSQPGSSEPQSDETPSADQE